MKKALIGAGLVAGATGMGLLLAVIDDFAKQQKHEMELQQRWQEVQE